jgi:hypothetical protein
MGAGGGAAWLALWLKGEVARDVVEAMGVGFPPYAP